uniref:Uncharacterized protein n=1 Tax=Salix viminalis TaxID=40686 RepID=A0A6N2KII4_SALVM
MSWSSELGTILAMDEWCKVKIQEIKGSKKFRHDGIEPPLKFKYDIIYSNIVITRKYVWAPSSGILGGDYVEPDTSNANIDAVDFEE